MKKEICIDARMATSSGIGTYISSLVPRLKSHYTIRLIVDPFSVDSIVRGIGSVWNCEEIRRELQRKGKNRAALFNWDICAEKHIEIIDRL